MNDLLNHRPLRQLSDWRPAKPRTDLAEKGRQQTEEDLELPDWNVIRYLDGNLPVKTQHWYPGAKRKSFETGSVFAWRMLPGLYMGPFDSGRSPFLPGRDKARNLCESMVRQVGVIDKFGSGRHVSFIPTLPYVPENEVYEPFAGPDDNPYRLLTTMLWRRKGTQLPAEWAPLVMDTTEINAYRNQAGLNSRFHTQLLLPLPKWRHFTYAWILKGYDIQREKDFEVKDRPFGADPRDGFQIVSFNDQVYKDLRKLYRRAAAAGSQDYFFPDPAAPDTGTVNYAWNRSFRSPIDGEESDGNGFGYCAGVDTAYDISPDERREVDLRIPGEFQQFYYENRMPWSSVLKGTVGIEQVKLLAEFFPELRCVCKEAWSKYRVLMEAWEEAFAGAPDSFDFYETLHDIYGSENSESNAERTVRTSRRQEMRDGDDSDRFYDSPESEQPDEAAFASPRSRTLSPVDKPGLPGPKADGTMPVKPQSDPVSAVTRQFYKDQEPDNMFDDSDQSFGDEPDDDVPF